MSKLTVTEKEHWKQRVERRIDRAIEELSHQHPEFMPDLRQQAKRKALARLKVDKLTDESDKLEATIDKLKSQQDELEKKIYLAASGKDEVPRHYYGLRSETDKVVSQHQTIIEDELLAESDIGNQFLKLRREKEELLDTIWLATSNRQIRDRIWTIIVSRLGYVITEIAYPIDVCVSVALDDVPQFSIALPERDALFAVVEYLADEESHYEQCCDAAQQDHVWAHRESLRLLLERIEWGQP